MIAFLGGTIGNFQPAQRASFLRRVANLLDPDDRFLLGTDLVKDRETLEARLQRPGRRHRGVQHERARGAQRRLDANFDLDAFEHVARWDAENLWIDIRLRSLRHQVIDIKRPRPAGRLRRRRGDAHRDLHQVQRPGLEGIYSEAGLEITDWWTDPEGLYALSLARAV